MGYHRGIAREGPGEPGPDRARLHSLRARSTFTDTARPHLDNSTAHAIYRPSPGEPPPFKRALLGSRQEKSQPWLRPSTPPSPPRPPSTSSTSTASTRSTRTSCPSCSATSPPATSP